ncbi:pentraxin fusion protein-like [Sphaeramia orbicularis]|uniref:pentraxin fusion protein-like n=1 Tax=Sphaeramia orbicularis TaxID=375764 RepID=UPI00117FD4B6|nr:pentraxin fusion protein-like [Sphaeramia orbicularis]
MRISAVVLIIAISVALTVSITIRSMIFPLDSSSSGGPSSTGYVEMIPQNPLNLRAFTLCMRLGTELSMTTTERSIILFAYRTSQHDELNVWQEVDGRLSLYLSGSSDGVLFQVPGLGALHTHLCLTWDSSSGATALFMNGQRSLTKIYKKNHNVSSGGRVILGQDPDSLLGDFDADQSFVGEIYDVNMWSSVLSDSTIQDMFAGRAVPRPDILDWETAELRRNGDTTMIEHEL